MTGIPSAALPHENAVAMQFLEGGEAILLAIRPSPWFVLVISRPLIVGASLLAIILHLAGPRMGLSLPQYTLTMLWTAAVLGRLALASVQWMGRLYVLTTRRLITVHGLTQFQVLQCPLPKVVSVRLAAGRTERLIGLGTLSFILADGQAPIGDWVNLARAAKVKQDIEKAMRACGG
jgi:hypothetical protein